MVCSLFGVHWVILSSVVELIACWSGKFFRIKTKVLGECFFIVLCGSFGGKGIHAPLKEWKIDSWVEASLPSYFVWMGKYFGCFYFQLFAWYAFFLYFHCYLVFISLLPLAHCLCAFFLFIFLYLISMNFITKKKKKRKKKKKPLLQASLDILPWWVQITSLSTTVHLLWGLFNFVLFYMCWGKGGRILER